MPTTMNCPGCQTPLRLREDMAGRKIKCPRCATVVTVPGGEAEMLEALPADEGVTAEPPAPRSRSKPARTRPCPECGEPVAVTASKCRYCKAPLDDEDDEEDYRRQRSPYKPCPRCGEEGAKRVVWTPWGSFYGPALFTHVRCPGCGYAYNGQSGRSNLVPAVVFVTIPLVLILTILGFVGWIIYKQMAGAP